MNQLSVIFDWPLYIPTTWIPNIFPRVPKKIEARVEFNYLTCLRPFTHFPEVLFKMASEILRVDNQETLEALQREADELKKKLEDEKAKLKDIESKSPRKNVIVGVFGLLSWFLFALSFRSEKLSYSTYFRTIFCERVIL